MSADCSPVTVYQVFKSAQMAELVDALVSGTSLDKRWRFESSSGHQIPV